MQDRASSGAIRGVLEQIFGTAKALRRELLQGIPKQDLETCIRVLAQIRERAGAASVTRVQSPTERRKQAGV
jgi:hypothetical protein